MSATSTAQAPSDGLGFIVGLQKDIAQHLPGLVGDFEQRWDAAHAELSALGGSPFSTLSAACDRSDTFLHIKKMGPKVVPLVVERLVRENTAANDWAVLLYDALESDDQYCPSVMEQQADLALCRVCIVELNCQRNELLASRLAALTELMESTTLWNNLSRIKY
ncbi:uncharacterized protein B0I36DRAFT_326789 [Microdochium trichocladiopsis]|uniref:Uncharacterized protein n=1 Tax=Microdochium trichocladiopsis TaxID=1682393 RepID=A0A9P8Y462_9PEZI|nr:uncharacterized protein B0I36DRAFT_326789 [Microdochium trichocladiopsis]KAH7027275.1 hypothetical protein B0I36DRAFT_326789 [Microdochium trichocladiopsis]